MKYDYLKNMKEDIKQWLEDNDWKVCYEDMTRDQLEEKLNDDLWIEDSITGNGSGSYTFNRELAHEFVSGNEDLLKEAITCFGTSPEEVVERLDDYEWQDVTIRCYTLSQAISEVLDEEYENIDIFDDLSEACDEKILDINNYHIRYNALRNNDYEVFHEETLDNKTVYVKIEKCDTLEEALILVANELKERGC